MKEKISKRITITGVYEDNSIKDAKQFIVIYIITYGIFNN
jgi:hypothetical protein